MVNGWCRPPMPSSILEIFTRGLELFRRHSSKHGRYDKYRPLHQASWRWRKRNIMSLCFFWKYMLLFHNLTLVIKVSCIERLDSTKGEFQQDWSRWEKQLRDILNGNAAYFQVIQVKLFAFHLFQLFRLFWVLGPPSGFHERVFYKLVAEVQKAMAKFY